MVDHEKSGCDGKKGYLSWSTANSGLRHSRFKDRTGRLFKVKPYRCRFCAYWHIG